eukprot:7846621-Pyramimonas_sp.AAC.1
MWAATEAPTGRPRGAHEANVRGAHEAPTKPTCEAPTRRRATARRSHEKASQGDVLQFLPLL